MGHDTITFPDEDDLYEILDLLKGEEAKCFKTATLLKLKMGTVESIRKQTPDLGEAMPKLFTEWLNHNYNVDKFGPPTWKKLVEAVAAPNGGGNRRLADKIASLHPGMQMCDPDKLLVCRYVRYYNDQ